MVWDTSIGWVVLAAIVYFSIGSLWYSPVLFVKPWAKAQGFGRDGAMGKGFAQLLVASFCLTIILVLVEAYFVHIMKSPTALNGAYLGAKLWLGFVGPTSLINTLYEKRPTTVWLVDQGYHLVGLVVAGAILVH